MNISFSFNYRLLWTSTLATLIALPGSLPISVWGQSTVSPQLESEEIESQNSSGQLELNRAEQINQQIQQSLEEGKFSTELIPLAEEALGIRQRLLGDKHYNVVESLVNLATLYQYQSRYDEAELLFIKAVDIAKELFPEPNELVATSLNNLGFLYVNKGKFNEAETLYVQALEIRKKLFPQAHIDVAVSLSNLGQLYLYQDRYGEAEPPFIEALAMFKQLFPEGNLYVTIGLNNLAILYKYQGKYNEAEPFYIQPLEMRQKLFPEANSYVATSLNNLGLLYREQGRYQEAETILIQALEMRQQVFPQGHPDIAQSLNNLGFVYKDQERLNAAANFYFQALEMRQKLFPEGHPTVEESLNNLGILYMYQVEYTQAETFLIQALEMTKKLFSPVHSDIASSLGNLAIVYNLQGKYTKAEPLYLEALEIYKQIFPEEHPLVAKSLRNLASFYSSQEDFERAINFLAQGLEIEEQNLDTLLVTGSERRKREYIETISDTTDSAISLHIQNAPNNPQAANLALTTILRRKGRILDAVTDNLNLLRQNLTPEDQKLLDELSATRSQLARLIFRGVGDTPPEEYRNQVAQLKAQADEQESQLARRSAEFRTVSQPVTIEAVQKLIPADTTLVEIISYQSFDLAAVVEILSNGFYDGEAQELENIENTHYAAYILHSTGEPQWVNLGEAKPINEAVKKFRTALTISYRDRLAKESGRKLDELLMEPIRTKLGNTKKILLSPDSQLNLIPFAALVDENKQYLVENYSITYLTTGRDLLRLQNSFPSRQSPIVIANPEYNQPGDPTSITLVPNRNSSNQRSVDISKKTFDPLPGTAEEAKALREILPEVTVLTESQATENAIKQVQAPSILHIATHGFFLPDLDKVAEGDFTGNLLSSVNNFSFSIPPTAIGKENPLLRSGLALAGFNPRESGTEDGVLTALETASLNLRGTKLVVLSACETGKGEVQNGEGVYGLRRALVMAGAESQLFSLWNVDDNATKDLMVEYYQRLQNGEGRSEALRQVQLEMLNSKKYKNPYYWAAFLPSGNWESMTEDW